MKKPVSILRSACLPFDTRESIFLVSRHLIDFHINLLKRISLGKGARREKFVPIITKVRSTGDKPVDLSDTSI